MEQEELEKRLKWYESKYGPYYEKKGLRNWKNLFKKPTPSQMTVFLLVVIILIGALGYSNDTKSCRETLQTLPRDVCEACSEFRSNQSFYETEKGFNYSGVVFINKTE